MCVDIEYLQSEFNHFFCFILFLKSASKVADEEMSV